MQTFTQVSCRTASRPMAGVHKENLPVVICTVVDRKQWNFSARGQKTVPALLNVREIRLNCVVNVLALFFVRIIDA